jgi:hypothetical protein
MVRKNNLFFGRNALQHVIFMSLHFLPHPSALTRGSGVRGTADPVWVRNFFNCFRSL